MKFNSIALIILLCGTAFINVNAQSGFHLTRDINLQTDANPINNSWSNSTAPFAVLNNIMYFAANDGAHGNELWRSDGTSSGTFIVKDLEPGTGSSNPSQIIIANNKIFFITNNQLSSSERLWCSDGTAAGTTLLKDTVNSDGDLINVNGEVYFFLAGGPKLWKTDGTIKNTVMVKDLGSFSNNPYYSTSANGLLYFSMNTSETGRELWRSDGTTTGTFLLKDISPFNYSDSYGPSHFTVYNNKLYFSEFDSTGRNELWFTNGTTKGTKVIANPNNIYIIPSDSYSSLENEPFQIINGKLIMAAETNQTGEEIYAYNTTNGFSLLKDISPGSAGGFFGSFAKVGNQVDFIYTDTITNTDDIWSTDGSLSNTFLVKSFNRNNLRIEPLVTGNNGLLYFVTYTDNYGTELWKTNGMPGNAKLVKDIFTGPISSYPQCLTKLNNRMFFTATSDTSGSELWQTDGTAANTFRVSEINKSYTDSSTQQQFYQNYTYDNFSGSNFGAAIKNKLYFIASKPKTGLELYRSNGTESTTVLAKDINTGQADSDPRQFLRKNNYVYFLAEDTTYSVTLFKIDSLGIITRVIRYPVYISTYDVADNGLIFFKGYTSINSPQQLWRSDGTVNGTFALTDKISFDNSSHRTLRTSGNKAFFIGNDEINGTELWVSDGTIAGTHIIKDIITGSEGSYPYSLIPFKNFILFGAHDYNNPFNNVLWRSDGTASGTVKLNAVTPWGDHNYELHDNYNDYFCIIGGNLFFAGNNNVTGKSGLWKTNGYASGTVFVSNLNNAAIAIPSYLTNINGTLFFSSFNKNDLWISDGTTSGTKILKNITGNTYQITERCVANNKLFIVTNNPDSALWISDGTLKETHSIRDSVVLGLTNIRNIIGTDSSVFFDGYNLKYGSELYTAVVSNVNKPALALMSSIQQKNESFGIKVLGNPATSKVNLQINASSNENIKLIISDIKGVQILQRQYDIAGNTLNTSIDCSTWSSGLYIVRIVNNKNETGSAVILKE